MKNGFLTLFLVLLVTGCSGAKLHIHENDASLIIKDEIFKIFKIDDSFIYTDAYPFNFLGMRGKLYQFQKSNTEYISISVFKSKGPFLKVNITMDVLGNGYFESGGKKYYYYTGREHIKLKGEEYCGLNKIIQVPIQDEIKVIVGHSEDLNATGIHCDRWRDPWNLNDKQKEYLKRFNARSNQYIKILSVK
jgi:hypothetical protein